MTATYDPTLPTSKDRARSLLGDIDVSDGGANALRTDEAIVAVIAANGEQLGTAVLAEGLAAEYAQLPDSLSTGGTSFSWRERVKYWRDLAARIRTQLASDAAAAANNLLVATPFRGDEPEAEYLRPVRWFP